MSDTLSLDLIEELHICLMDDLTESSYPMA